MLPESSKIQRIGEIPEGTDPGRSIRSPGKGDGSNKVLSYIGLATRARKSVSGEFSVENSVRKGKAKLVVVSEEASENTKKKIRSLCEYYKVPLYVACSSAELGSACGKEFRMSVAVEDEGLAAAAIRVLE